MRVPSYEVAARRGQRALVRLTRALGAELDDVGIDRKRAEGKSTKEAIRCLKRHLARRVWHLLQPPHAAGGTPPSPSIS